jgi:hypothetical protein
MAHDRQSPPGSASVPDPVRLGYDLGCYRGDGTVTVPRRSVYEASAS